ncbi:hypothetical protein Pmar_PMAR013038 [Perkinsus marinus ATCC 50983]|uniref:Uncharacterized protein n=1 Tax=Perkinsus marinus (strain ATCC 50983 / TXsc) TaxID=423536 RepID=C5KUP2_PERM5|nr:hypothetical protein Pmar_PMAR013038 [Perkinsus marinus ATCC 50983]EER11763.1 hypothetical protein Pmar_PMAR013038 [Perkinsus marinus ATCC 50983]|eukprot:XP_002779968.1 hypothetical protein Pmar_PMAR013038 [Perkinsus marinus ATCC 50983]
MLLMLALTVRVGIEYGKVHFLADNCRVLGWQVDCNAGRVGDCSPCLSIPPDKAQRYAAAIKEILDNGVVINAPMPWAPWRPHLASLFAQKAVAEKRELRTLGGGVEGDLRFFYGELTTPLPRIPAKKILMNTVLLVTDASIIGLGGYLRVKQEIYWFNLNKMDDPCWWNMLCEVRAGEEPSQSREAVSGDISFLELSAICVGVLVAEAVLDTDPDDQTVLIHSFCDNSSAVSTITR